MLKTKQLERIVRGFSNHRRIEIMALLARAPELSVQEVSDQLAVNFKTISEHIRRLALTGMVTKRHQGAAVRHTLSSRGKVILKFLRT